jgi:membrane protease YdiL (CAAX protease family)
MRTAIALLLAIAAMVLALPGDLLPWIAHLRLALHADRLLATVLISLLFALAGRLLPVPAVRPARVDHTGLTVGLLLLLEPVLHLAVLGVCARVANPYGAEALLPATWTPPMAGSGYAMRLVVLVAVTPVCEEFFFRGRLLPWLRGHMGAFSAVSISTLAFAAAHGDLMQLSIALPVGLLLGCMRLAGADLGACMLAHAVHNGLFLIAGPCLVGLPLAAPLLAGAGVLLVVVAWFYHVRPRPDQLRRALITALVAAIAIAIAAPFYRHLADRWWVAGTHRLCVYWRVPNEQLLARLLAQERNRRLTDARRESLADVLRAAPCQTAPRQVALLALLDPSAAPAGDNWEDDAAVLFDELADPALAGPSNGELARRLGRRFPTAFADAVLERPEALRRWLPLPARAMECALQLECTTGNRDRRILLVALERNFPGAVADVLHRLPASSLRPIDRRHLRLHYGEQIQGGQDEAAEGE